MPITALDIKLRKSQRLTDNPDGGGRMVAAEIVDGEMNNLFPDIGDEERTTGRSTLRKMFVHVDTADTDVLKDAIGIIINPPMDSHVHMSMFSTGSYSDVREEAKNRVEGYITKGVQSRYVLFGNHFIGQMAINLYCMKDAATPEVNDNLCLATDAAGYTPHEQYIRVRSILARTTETFYDDVGAFERDVIVIEIVSALLYDFYGQEASRRTSIKPPSLVYETNTVDAASYYSVKRLVADAEVGDLSVKVDSPYVPIVPSTQAETPVVDQLAGLGTVTYPQAGDTDALALTFSSAFSAGVAVPRFLGSPFARGSVKVTAGSVDLTDDGSGNLVAAGLSPWHGSVDYAAGSVSVINDAGVGSTSVNVLATPAGQVVDQGFTQKIDITIGNQGYNYLFTLNPLPAAGTVVVDYRALGRWIRLADNGTGQLIGKPGQGSGTVNYTTGSVVLTAGALPDVDSAVLCSYGTGVTTERRDGDSDIEPPKLNFLLPNEDIKPGTVEISWIVSGSPVVATDDGAGVLEVGATAVGTIAYASGEVNLTLTTLPDSNSLISSEYEWSSSLSSNLTPVPDGSGIVSFTLPDVPARAGSLTLDWLTSVRPSNNDDLGAPTIAVRMIAKDDGAGNIVGVSAAGARFTTTLGTIDYTTGAVSVKVGQITINQISFPNYVKMVNRGEYWRVSGSTRAAGTANFSGGTIVVVKWQEAASGSTTETAEIDLPPVKLDLTPGIIDAIVPGSVRFTFKGRTYVDRGGSLYYGIDPVSGSGTYAGIVDYASGYAVITSWAAGGSNAVSIQALLSQIFEPGTDALYFRTPGSPLRPGAFTMRATTLDGELVTATSDISGNLTGDLIEGTVDWDSGVVKVRFGEMVTASGNEGEPWYDVANVVGLNVWKPFLMIPSTIYFNTVVYRSIPLSPVVVGLDPNRLPSDGRVPAFKPGQTVLIHNTEVIDVASPTANQVVDFGRDRIAQIEVRDDDGVPVLSSWYTVDLDVGELVFSDPLNLSAYNLPIHISHRIDDRRLVAAVQITGDIELNTALSHDFPADSTMISTALRLGEANGSLDLQARVQGLFDQATWTNVWQDTLIGSAASGTFNDTDYPLVVTNADAITERWVLRFTNATTFDIVGETVGTIGTGVTGTDCAPENPRTGLPYFTIDYDGWGTGWATGNALRFNTVGGLAPVWMVRTTLAGTPEEVTDSFRFQVVGNSAGVTP
jgi:hypothetical protein